MRIAPGRLCFLISTLSIANFVGFLAFVSKQWKFGRVFRQFSCCFNDSIIPNVTDFPYVLARHQESLVVDCSNPTSNLGDVPLTVNMTAAEEIYWKESNTAPPNETFNGTSTFLGTHNAVNDVALFQPQQCYTTYSVAIIIPFRDREAHLKVLLGHMVPILQRQLARYSIFVIEQGGNETFNKGRLMNTGFEFATRIGKHARQPYDCFIFQDVDLLAERDALLYRCSKGDVVYHMSTTINKFDYKPLCCGMTVGGVLAFEEKQFRKVNGFSNAYWGWGGEDDDMNKRIRYKRLSLIRPTRSLGRYTMIKHERDERNPYNNKVTVNVRFALQRFKTDGLSSLSTQITRVESYPLFTKVLVDVGKPT